MINKYYDLNFINNDNLMFLVNFYYKCKKGNTGAMCNGCSRGYTKNNKMSHA